MIENLKIFMKKKYNYQLNEYKVCAPKIEKSKFRFWPSYLFILILVGYALQAFAVIPVLYSIVGVELSGIILILFQITMITKNKSEALIITPEYLIKSFGIKKFTAIKYDDIKKFRLTDKEGIVLSDRRNEISIAPNVYREFLGPVIDILEAKGKTFDKSRDYMKRDVEIHIVNNNVVITEIEEEVSSTEKLVGEYYDEFNNLTPGFIVDVIFLNSIVEDAYSANNNLFLSLDKIEVKEGHPENTGFESLAASNCLVIFEDIKVKYAFLKSVRDREAKEETLTNNVETIVGYLDKGVIADWKYRKNGIDLHFAVGTHFLKVSFDYKEVIIGWKNAK